MYMIRNKKSKYYNIATIIQQTNIMKFGQKSKHELMGDYWEASYQKARAKEQPKVLGGSVHFFSPQQNPLRQSTESFKSNYEIPQFDLQHLSFKTESIRNKLGRSSASRPMAMQDSQISKQLNFKKTYQPSSVHSLSPVNNEHIFDYFEGIKEQFRQIEELKINNSQNEQAKKEMSESLAALRKKNAEQETIIKKLTKELSGMKASAKDQQIIVRQQMEKTGKKINQLSLESQEIHTRYEKVRKQNTQMRNQVKQLKQKNKELASQRQNQLISLEELNQKKKTIDQLQFKMNEIEKKSCARSNELEQNIFDLQLLVEQLEKEKNQQALQHGQQLAILNQSMKKEIEIMSFEWEERMGRTKKQHQQHLSVLMENLQNKDVVIGKMSEERISISNQFEQKIKELEGVIVKINPGKEEEDKSIQKIQYQRMFQELSQEKTLIQQGLSQENIQLKQMLQNAHQEAQMSKNEKEDLLQNYAFLSETYAEYKKKTSLILSHFEESQENMGRNLRSLEKQLERMIADSEADQLKFIHLKERIQAEGNGEYFIQLINQMGGQNELYREENRKLRKILEEKGVEVEEPSFQSVSFKFLKDRFEFLVQNTKNIMEGQAHRLNILFQRQQNRLASVLDLLKLIKSQEQEKKNHEQYFEQGSEQPESQIR